MKYLLIILLIFLINSCQNHYNNESYYQSDTLSQPFLQATEYYTIEDLNGWELDVAFEESDKLKFETDNYYSGGLYYYRKIDTDTLLKLSLEYYESKDDTIFIPLGLYKRYRDNYFQYVILYGKNQDTLFHYKASLFGSLNKIFIKGKYYYMYRFHNLNNRQVKYFKKNKDSLTKIAGHNLPALPELHTEQKKLLD